MGGGSPGSLSPAEELVLQMSSLTADENGESLQQTASEEPVQVRLLYSKSKVYVHPKSDSEDNIPGFLCIVERSPNSFLLAWTPESLLSADELESYVQVEDGSDRELDDDESSWIEAGGEEDHGLGSTILIAPPPTATTASVPTAETQYAISIPINSIYSIIVKPPKFQQWYGSVVINLVGGITLPALYFHDDESRSTRLQRQNNRQKNGEFAEEDEEDSTVAHWGGDELIKWLGKVAVIVSSVVEPNLLLVNPTTEDLVNHSPPATEAKPSARVMQGTSRQRPLSVQMDPLVSAVKEIRWNVMERFSKVARFSRDAAATILEHPLARPILPHLPPALNNIAQSENARVVIDEYDAGRVYLAKWAARVAEEAESQNDKTWIPLYKPIEEGGSVHFEEDTELGSFEILSSKTSLPPIRDTRTTPLSAENWFSFFDTEGRLKVEAVDVRQAIFRGGIEEDIRTDVWKFLLNVYPWDSSEVERANILEAKRQEYFALKSEWWSSTEVQAGAVFQDHKVRIGVLANWQWAVRCVDNATTLTVDFTLEKDVIRTDRSVSFFKSEDMPHPDPLAGSSSNLTNKNLELMKDILMTYNFYNKDLGYVQGMSDLLAPLFAVMNDEVTAFWAFVGFMDRMKYNFYEDQTGMRRQLLTLNHLIQFMDPAFYKHLQKTESLNLFCCFRWMLIWFKREFSWDDVARLWEVLWSDYLTGQFHLFVALAILEKHSRVIIEYLPNFDEILKYINDLSMDINLEDTLKQAEMLFYQFQRMIAAIDAKRMEQGESEQEETYQGLRKRLNKQPENGEGSSTQDDTTNKLPVIPDDLRDLLNKEWPRIVAEQTSNPVDLTPSSRLAELLYIAKEQDEGDEVRPCEVIDDDVLDDDEADVQKAAEGEDGTITHHSKYISNIDPDNTLEPKEAPNYSTWYMTTHRAASTCAIFSGDGKYAATGSADASLKVLDTSKMNSRSDEDRPVIRTLYDHLAPVNDLSFHPNGLVLASCSDDQSIKLFDLSKPGVKRSFRYLQDTHIVRSIAFHPSGDFILAGTDDESIRVYDVKSFNCYTASTNQNDLHHGGITRVRFSYNGSQFITSSLDGSIKIWDVVTGRCIRTIEQAHGGSAVSSVRFSKNGKYVLSGGRDSLCKLWEATSGRCLITYDGAAQKNNTLQTTFTYNEDFVLSCDESNNTIVTLDLSDASRPLPQSPDLSVAVMISESDIGI
ncbi:6044_t:CDS:10 [Paraglomus occultum]|uniref:GTPase-activating protein GYP7 n=1 Tax=Paraglomus occultum TaxID=144539 RepID=A0A9N9FJG0_9GLOM|nr:6044_t:CDS:10 [Paraglomus occultum]